MKTIKKAFKIIVIALISLTLIMTVGLFIYTIDSYGPLPDMRDGINELNLDGIEIIDDFDQISFLVDQPKKNIVIIPGGKVKPESYQYLAANLARSGYDVTIVKTLFNVAILTPNYGARFLKDGIDNVVIGHSLGGTVGSIFSEGDLRVSHIIFLASYPISRVSDKDVLVITGELDLVLDHERLFESQELMGDNAEKVEIEGGNHAQFGWYGPQKGDGVALIDTKTQQDLVINLIIQFIG